MIFLFYNKILLRILVLLTGVATVFTAWHYISLSVQKLPETGARDAQAIISFMIAGWLVMVIAEVIDNHYVRAFGCLCVGLGGVVSFNWLFNLDGPKLVTLQPNGPAGMENVKLGFWCAMGLALAMFLILVIRLVLDKQNFGRQPVAAAKADQVIGPVPEGMGQPPPEPDLPPIPVDVSPLSPAAGSPQPAPAQSRTPAPISKLVGIGGLYLGHSFDLAPGVCTLGRSDADIELADDNQVSRRHAQIAVGENGIATLTDLGSTNGTFLNNQPVSAVKLAPGDVLRIGTSLFKAEA